MKGLTGKLVAQSYHSQFRSCVRVEVAVLVSVDVKNY